MRIIVVIVLLVAYGFGGILVKGQVPFGVNVLGILDSLKRDQQKTPAQLAVLQLLDDKIVDDSMKPLWDFIRKLEPKEYKRELVKELKYQKKMEDRIKWYAPVPSDSLLFAINVNQIPMSIFPIERNPVLQIPYDLYGIRIKLIRYSLPSGTEPSGLGVEATQLPKAHTIICDPEFTFGVKRKDFYETRTDSLPSMIFLGRDYLSYSENLALIRHLLQQEAPSDDSIWLKELVRIDAYMDHSPQRVVFRSVIDGGWNLSLLSFSGLWFDVNVFSDHIDYSFLETAENISPLVKEMYIYEHRLGNDYFLRGGGHMRFLRQKGASYIYEILTTNGGTAIATYHRGKIRFER